MNGKIENDEELKEAYADFCQTASPAERAAIDRILQTAHQQAKDVLAPSERGAPPKVQVQYPSLATAWSELKPETEPVDPRLKPGAAKELFGMRDPVDGQGLIWGTSKYLQLDTGWTEALVGFFKYRNKHAPFGAKPQIIEIPDPVTLALAGDWGTEFWRDDTPAQRVQELIQKGDFAYTLHLGDVYYSGAEDEERAFVDHWPKGKLGSFTLNSNHEMYSGGQTYFDIALSSGGKFAQQQGTSYFALVNNSWLLFGIDTAYFSPASNLYMDGTIDESQQRFLQATAAKYSDRRLAIVSHNEGFDLKGGPTNALWAQVETALGRSPDYWFWGHAHNAVVYKPRKNCRCRCIGHGAVPYGVASDLKGAPEVDWYEKGSAGDDRVPRVLNGHLELILDGRGIEEKLRGEDGSLRWSASDSGRSS